MDGWHSSELDHLADESKQMKDESDKFKRNASMLKRKQQRKAGCAIL